jgi:hypothetical protein
MYRYRIFNTGIQKTFQHKTGKNKSILVAFNLDPK